MTKRDIHTVLKNHLNSVIACEPGSAGYTEAIYYLKRLVSDISQDLYDEARADFPIGKAVPLEVFLDRHSQDAKRSDDGPAPRGHCPYFIMPAGVEVGLIIFRTKEGE